jgi:hypothetical protein
MSWLSLILRMITCIVLLLLILWWAEVVIPMGSVLVLILLMGLISTWAILTLLKDDRSLEHYP